MIQPNRALLGVFYCDPEDTDDPSNWFTAEELPTLKGKVKLFVTVQYQAED